MDFRSLLLRPAHYWRRLIRVIWITSAVVAMGVPLYVSLVIYNPYNLFGGMPSLDAIENPENDLSSEVISADGVSLGRYFRYNNRSQLSYDQFPPLLINTLLVSEDHRFLEHSGMDFKSYIRVVLGLITFQPQGGGSTLTQQVAKNMFSTRGEELRGRLSQAGKPIELLISKTKEWIISVRLERNFTKEEIIALYLNTVPFNNNAFGIKIASETYFRKPVRALNIQESALLVGMLQSTFAFNPVQFPERSVRKRNEVLRKMYRHGYIKTSAEYDSIAALPLQLNFSVQNHNQGLATYFRSILQQDMMKWCKENGYDLFESGLKIHVTLDSRMQRFAEDAMHNHMARLQQDFNGEWGVRDPWVDDAGRELKDFIERKVRQTHLYNSLIKKFGKEHDSVNYYLSHKKQMKVFTWKGERDTLFSTIDSIRYYNRFLHTGMVSINPNSGEVKAWVGGINHKFFKYDHVKQGKRQPGSTFKPFVYAKAIEDNYSPCAIFNDASPAININGKIYQAANSNGSYGDGSPYTLRKAMARSLNSVTMQLMERLKPENVASFAARLGIKSQLDPVYSLGLGTSDVSLYEMVAAYSGFVNLGIYTEPFYISRIEDKYGNVLETFTPNRNQVMDERTAYKMVYMLRGGVEEEGGSSGSLSSSVLEDNEVGGKTGTTDNASDGWYIGVTHNLVTGVWVGGDERSIHFPNWRMGSGGRSALPMWDQFMRRIYQYSEIGYPKGQFKRPGSDIDERELNCKDDDGVFQISN